ncbi:sulfite exporter TauE/SafE family protein [Nodosilinea sp. LEGE 07088]|uniref:sulfite exporter TauE/SafE family protein n=1 Tax=Nodosilinea sp. LEGE 07088 TaxID=2777968 RepID=UPI001D13C93E|nr:sulfite exporter TauE/SafE family protein [Nodosilinea sp. LEGE 07088]
MTLEFSSLEWIVIVTMFGAAFVQGVTGFAFAMVSMGVLSGVTSVQLAAPLVALAALTNHTAQCLYYRRAFDRIIVAQLLLGAVLGIPFGLLALRFLPETWMLIALGSVILAYSLYSLVGPRGGQLLKSKRWIYGAGFLSGALNGSYNLPGPPVVVYASSQNWPQERFKGNLISFFWVNAVLVVIGHSLDDRFSVQIIHQFLLAIPGILLGQFLGVSLSKHLNPPMFQKITAVILAITGVRIITLGL